jgi:hypothetical protein
MVKWVPMKVEVIPSKEEIYKNMALILVDAERKAKKAIEEARAENQKILH